MPVVSGTVLLDGWQGEPGPATIRIRLLDTSLADAPAKTVGETILHNVLLEQVAEQGIEFCIVAPELDPRARYEVGVLVDLDGTGRKSAGDYINTRSYPVLTRGYPDRVEVLVHRIG